MKDWTDKDYDGLMIPDKYLYAILIVIGSAILTLLTGGTWIIILVIGLFGLLFFAVSFPPKKSTGDSDVRSAE